MTAGSTTPDIDASLTAAGHFSGTVRDLDGDPLEGVSGGACRWDEDASAWVFAAGWPETDADGNYDSGPLEPGTYRVTFYRYPDLGMRFYDNAITREAGTDVVVTEGGDLTGIDADLGPAAHISGRLTSMSGDPLEGIEVYCYTYHPGSADYVMLRWVEFTGTSGDYDFPCLPEGAYRVRFHDPADVFTDEFYDDVATVEEAEDIALTWGETRSDSSTPPSLRPTRRRRRGRHDRWRCRVCRYPAGPARQHCHGSGRDALPQRGRRLVGVGIVRRA